MGLAEHLHHELGGLAPRVEAEHHPDVVPVDGRRDVVQAARFEGGQLGLGGEQC